MQQVKENHNNRLSKTERRKICRIWQQLKDENNGPIDSGIFLGMGSQWETNICNIISNWLSPYAEWSLLIVYYNGDTTLDISVVLHHLSINLRIHGSEFELTADFS